jgi:hypothetical protein
MYSRKTKKSKKFNNKSKASSGPAPIGYGLKSVDKVISSTLLYTSSVTGSIGVSTDLVSLLTAEAEFTNMAAVFQRLKVVRITLEFLPIMFTNTVAGLATQAVVALGYSPTLNSAPAGYDVVLDAADSILCDTSARACLAIKPYLASGVSGYAASSQYSLISGYLGYLRAFAPAASFPNSSTSTFNICVRFWTKWQYGN